MFCKHSWEIIDKHETQSKIERLGKSKIKISIPSFLNVAGIEYLVRQSLIHVVVCKKCGKIKKYITKF